MKIVQVVLTKAGNEFKVTLFSLKKTQQVVTFPTLGQALDYIGHVKIEAPSETDIHNW